MQADVGFGGSLPLADAAMKGTRVEDAAANSWRGSPNKERKGAGVVEHLDNRIQCFEHDATHAYRQ